MVKISNEEKSNQKVFEEAKQQFITGFSSRFTLEHLKELFELEEPNKYRRLNTKRAKAEEELGEDSVKSKIQMKDEDYEVVYPKCLQYIRDNIFRADKGRMFYIISVNDDGNLAPIEYSREEMNDKLKFFPNDINHWFNKIFCKEYRIDCSNTEKKVYIKNGINHLNIFNGYKFDGILINDCIHTQRKNDIEFMWNHLFEVLCSRNTKIFEYLKKWICAMIGGRRKMTTAWYMKGKRGVGKSKFVTLLSNIISQANFFTVKHQNQIMQEFNGHFLAKVLVFVDDVEFTGQNFLSFGETMKTYITEQKLAFRDLFKTATQMNNITSWIVAGNQDVGALKDGNVNERARWVVSDLSPHLKSSDYFDRLVKLAEKDEHFWKAFYLDCVKNYDPKFNEQDEIKLLPITKTKEEQIQKTMPTLARMFKHYLIEEPSQEFFQVMKFSDFYNDYYLEWHKFFNVREKNSIQKHTLFNDLQILPYVSIAQRRINNSPTKNTVLIDKEKLLKDFMKNKYIVESDDIDIPIDENDNINELIKEEHELYEKLKEIEQKKMKYYDSLFKQTSKKTLKKVVKFKPVVIDSDSDVESDSDSSDSESDSSDSSDTDDEVITVKSNSVLSSKSSHFMLEEW